MGRPKKIKEPEIEEDDIFGETLKIEEQVQKSDNQSGKDDTIKQIEIKEKEGFSIVYTDHETLLLDLDSKQDVFWYDYALPIVNKLMNDTIKEKTRWVSKSGKGLHVVLESSCYLNITERLLLQCILGSDRIRELYSYMRRRKITEDKVSVLFRPPEKKQ